MLYKFLKSKMLQFSNQTISDGTRTITYKELLNEAENYASNLTENKYGILFDSDLDTAKALLACLYARKTAVMLSKKYGDLHTKRIIDAIGLSFIISDEGIQTVETITHEYEDLNDVAIIMCTSGTTGIPKGAMITHDNLITNLTDINAYFNINSSDHILIARPLYHCAVLTGEFLISLIKGLKITFVSEGFIPNRILGAAKDNKVTVLCGTPTLMYHLSKLNLKAKEPLKLRSMAISGECMTEEVAKVIRKAFCDTEIYNVYGLTEASPRVTYLPPQDFDKYPLSVGYPLNSLEAKICDNELLIKGDSVMKGYYSNKTATQKAKQDGWLHTGDIAEIDKDGRIYIKCRKDNMIIRAGMNIYPQEIENALKANSSVIDVMAYSLKDNIVSEKICIKVVTKLSKPEIYNICKQVLSSYELPDVIDIVDEIPKNASGKVIRNVTRN